MISSWINPCYIRDFSRLEVALQQAGESLAVAGLVAGHLSRRRAGRFASYGETLPPQGFPVLFISHNTTSKSKCFLEKCHFNIHFQEAHYG